jgi:hypothetical protein
MASRLKIKRRNAAALAAAEETIEELVLEEEGLPEIVDIEPLTINTSPDIENEVCNVCGCKKCGTDPCSENCETHTKALFAKRKLSGKQKKISQLSE